MLRLILLFFSLLFSVRTAAGRWEPRRDALARIRPIWSIVSVEGTHNEIGFKIGSTFRSQILAAMKNNTFFNEKMLPYNQTTEGSLLYLEYFDTASKRYPQYMDELRGMADGSQIPFSEVFLWNLMFEWQLLLEPWTKTLPTTSCSDLFLANGEYMCLSRAWYFFRDFGSVPSLWYNQALRLATRKLVLTTAMGHNEDGSPIDLSTGYLMKAQVMEESGSVENFFAYCYAGQLCGNAFGYNGKGVVTTVNAVFPKNLNTSSIASNFLARSTLTSSYEEIQKTLQEVPCSSGFSLNVGNAMGNMTISNFEVAPSGAVETKIKGYSYHFNLYLHSDVPQYEDPSSEHRLARVRELPPPTDARDIATILGDTEDKKYPIYRTATPPDTAVTLATGVFDMSGKLLNLYRGNPAHTEPVVIPLPDLI